MGRRLQGKVALVTGGAQGIGAAVVRRLAQEGAAVVIADILVDAGRALAQELRGREAHAEFFALDVASEAQWTVAVAYAVRTFGALQLLVNNAGVARTEDVEQETTAGFKHVTDVNQLGVMLGMRESLPAIRRAGGGAIVNVSSIYGAVGGNGEALAYHASKGAVRLMTKSAAIHLAKANIRVNSVHPGFIDTPMLQPLIEEETDKARAFRRFALERTPMARLGRPEEIAATIAFLLSDDASYITGAEIYVDGGFTAA